MSILRKRRDMPVDLVYEDSFYANILLGLPKTLASRGVEDTKIRRNPPCTSYDIFHWEQKHGVRLPNDLKNFYASCDGFLFFWAVNDPEHEDVKVVSGKIQINPLEHLVRILEEDTRTINSNHKELRLGLDSRIFALEPIDSTGHVVLLYKKIRLPPTIWFCGRNLDFHFLANDFTTYMRMAIAHLGILQWQMAYAGMRTSETCSELFRLYLPHYSMAEADDLEDEEEQAVVNKVDSNYMLNMKFQFLDCGKQESRPSSPVSAKKVNKNCPSKVKAKLQQGKKNQPK